MCGINSADIDLAVRLGPLPDSSMVATRVGGVRRVVCGSPSYFSAHGIPRTPADLADLTCVTFANLAAGTSWSFASRSKDLAQAPRPRCRLTINTAEAAIDAAIAGIGITHAYQVAQAISEGKLRIVLTDYGPNQCPCIWFMPVKVFCF